MKSITVILTTIFLFVTFVGIINAQVENLQQDVIEPDAIVDEIQGDSFEVDEAGVAKQEVEKQPKPMIQLVIYWLVILILAYAAAKLCTHILNQLANRRKKPGFILGWLLPILRAIIYSCAFYIVFSGIIRRIEPGGVYIIIGALAIALGLAFKDLLSSWLGGFIILFDRSFRIGDRIEIDGYEGEVTSMGLFSVKVMTSDGQLVVVPNSRFFRQSITSVAADSTNSPVEVEFILPSSVPLEQMERIAKEAALTSKYIYLDEPVLVTSTDDFRGIFLTKLKIKASVFDFRYATQFAEDIRRRVKAELRQQRSSK